MTAGAGEGRANPLDADLDLVVDRVGGDWERLRGARLFITGGTGFFGRWLLESLVRANRRLGLGATAVLLTRDPGAFRRNAPHLAADPALSFHVGDVRDFAFPPGEFSHVIHGAATSAVETFRRVDPLVTFDIVLEGTRRSLELAMRCGAEGFLLIGSGAVYGCQPAGLTHVPEDYPGAPSPPLVSSALAEAKRAAECLCALRTAGGRLEAKIARCFSFVGPYLPLDVHYAVGNFIRDALAGGPVRVHGDGTQIRSYLYAADLAAWLWTILLRGLPCRPYNVGSEESVSIADLAGIVARCGGRVAVQIAGGDHFSVGPDRYVPSTLRARQELRLEAIVPLEAAVAKTLASHLRQRGVR